MSCALTEPGSGEASLSSSFVIGVILWFCSAADMTSSSRNADIWASWFLSFSVASIEGPAGE